MQSDPIRTALLGAGNIAPRHIRAIQETKGVSLTAVCDVSEAAANALAQPIGAQVFTDFSNLIASKTCDAVHILAPPPLHSTLAIQAFEGGLHCYVEKPVALSVDETKKMVLSAQAHNRVFAAGHNFMGSDKYRKLHSLCRSGALGRVSSADIHWHLPLAPLRSGPFGSWLMQKRENLLFEFGPHLFGFANDLFVAPLSIEHVSIGKLIEIPGCGHTCPQSWRITACAGDVDVNISLSLAETVEDRSVSVQGSSGLAHFDFAADRLIVHHENSSDIILNALRTQSTLAWQHIREGLENAATQVLSLNRKSPYDLSFQGAIGSFYEAIRNCTDIDVRFSGEAATSVMQAIDDTVTLLPPEEAASLPPQIRAPKPNILVIGGTGFIGRILTRKLVARGHDVRVLSRGRSGPFDDLADQVELMAASLKNREELDRAMKGIDAVFHLGKALEDTWEGCLENDVEVTVSIAEAALRARVRNFVYTGTIASYDMSKSDLIISEDTPFAEDLSDRNLYARSKAECERRLLIMQKEKKLPLTIARPGIVVGKTGPLQHWGIGRWHGSGAVRIWGRGRNILPFVLVEDVADGLVQIIETDTAIGQSFNLVGEPMLSGRDYFHAIHERLGVQIQVKSSNLYMLHCAATIKHFLKRYFLRRSHSPLTSYNDWKSRAHLSSFDNSYAKRVLNWQPEVSREDFLKQAIDEAFLFGF